MVQPTVDNRSQDFRLDQHVEQILKIQATINEIRTIRDREREEEREFQKAMLTWMKQHDPALRFSLILVVFQIRL